MADSNPPAVPTPSAEHRRIAAEQFQRANEVISSGNFDYGIQLLLTCCQLDPANLVFRQTLRRTEKIKYKNNLRGDRLAMLTTSASKTRMKAARRSNDHLKVLKFGEEVLARNPWDSGAQLDMAEAAAGLGLLDLGVWILEQARQKDPKDATVNRALARLYEKRGNFVQAVALWDMVKTAQPLDTEAQAKVKDLSASETIVRGGYVAAFVAATEGKPEPGADEETKTEGEEGAQAKAPIDRVSQAAIPLRARIDADPTNVNAYIQLAGLYRRVDQLDKAREVLQQGLGPTGNSFDLGIELIEVDLEPFRRNLAITERKLKDNPKDEELKKQRIRLMKEINTRELDLFRQKADRYPNEKVHRFEMGVRLLRAGQVEEAIRELQPIRNDPRHQWRALMYLGYCFKTRNNWRLAERNFEESLKALPPGEDTSRKELLFQLSQGSAEAGDLAKAVEMGLELANLDYSFRDIGRLVESWQEKLHKRSEPGS